MKQETFLKILSDQGFPAPIFVVREKGGFINPQSLPFEVLALVLDGQIDIVVASIKNVYLAGDTFYLAPNQMHAQNFGSKGVKYLASRKGVVLQEELGLEHPNTQEAA